MERDAPWETPKVGEMASDLTHELFVKNQKDMTNTLTMTHQTQYIKKLLLGKYDKHSQMLL